MTTHTTHSGISFTLTEEEEADAHREFPAGTRVQIITYEGEPVYGVVVEQSANRGLTWLKDVTVACASPAFSTWDLRAV